jgi:hypothetical protein
MRIRISSITIVRGLHGMALVRIRRCLTLFGSSPGPFSGFIVRVSRSICSGRLFRKVARWWWAVLEVVRMSRHTFYLLILSLACGVLGVRACNRLSFSLIVWIAIGTFVVCARLVVIVGWTPFSEKSSRFFAQP